VDENLKAALLKLAQGYEAEERIVTGKKGGKPEQLRIVRRHVPPDLRAIEKVAYLQAIGRW
jgi:hypothetical protein